MTMHEVMALFAPRPTVFVVEGMEGDYAAVEQLDVGNVRFATLIALSDTLARKIDAALWNYTARKMTDVANVSVAAVVAGGDVIVPVAYDMGPASDVRLRLKEVT